MAAFYTHKLVGSCTVFKLIGNLKDLLSKFIAEQSGFINFFTDENTIGTLCYSLVVAATVTVCCTLVAYPVAYILARSNIKKKNVLLVLFIAPMWINFTLRVVALKEVLTMMEGNLAYHPFLNTVIGMTYDFLPFMILPLYTTLGKLDNSFL